MVLEFILPSPPPHSESAYWKHARRQAMEIPMVGIAMMLAVEVVNASPIKDAFARDAIPPFVRHEIEALPFLSQVC